MPGGDIGGNMNKARVGEPARGTFHFRSIDQDWFAGILKLILKVLAANLQMAARVGTTLRNQLLLGTFFAKKALGLHYSPLEDSGRASPPKPKQLAFCPL